MALFKSRKAGDDAATAARQPESIEAMRRRARHRLIGAGVLVLIGVLGFPLLFDTQPRPIAVDIPIEIPDRDKVKPLQAPKPAVQSPAVSGAVTPSASSAAKAPPPAAAAVPAKEIPVPAPTPETKVAAVTTAKPESQPENKPAARPEARPETKTAAKADSKPADTAKARSAAEAKTVAAAPAEGRFVVQVGSFADAGRAREVRARVERAGLKTYTHVADTKDGKRIRVRVGPFETRGEADKAASKIKGLDMPAAILTL